MNESLPRETRHLRETAGRPGHRHAPHPASPEVPASVFVYGWLLATVSVAVFLAAKPAQGSLGIFLIGTGIVLICFPARSRVEWPLWLAAAGMLFSCAVAFLPARWFTLPRWRMALDAAPAIHLPSTVTPVPWETGFWLAILGVSCLTGLFLFSHPIRSRAVLGIAAAAVVVCGAYATLSIYARQTGWHYPFTGEATFGFFPNRNHTATFLVTGSVAALGVLTVSLREKKWILAAIVATAMAICVAGLFFFSGSRGGVIFLGVGTLIWVSGLGRAHWNVPLFVTVVALTLAGGTLFLISGGEARARLLGKNEPKASEKSADKAIDAQRLSGEPAASADNDTAFGFRKLIYRDTIDMIKDAPVSGTGLGAFAPVFAEYRRASLSASTPIHPESDWLMIAAESGLPMIAFALVTGGFLLARLHGARQHPFWPLRWACVAAAGTAVLHGIVDVPTHRVALGWWVLVLAGLGFQSGRGQEDKSPLFQRLLFVAGGLGALVLGVQLIRAEWFGASALPPFAASRAREEVLARFNRQDTAGALELAQAAVEQSPVSAPLYYQVGDLLLHFEGTDAEASQSFEAQRILSPTSPSVPLQQGDTWLPVDLKRAVALWLDALERQRRIDRAQGIPDTNLDGYFRRVLEHAAPSADAQRELAVTALRSPEFLLTWIEAAAPSIVREKMPSFVAENELLAQLSAVQREKFLLLWYAKGQRNDLARFLDENPSWQASGWSVRLRTLVDAGRFEDAVHSATEHYHISLTLPAVATPQNRNYTPPDTENNPLVVFDLYWRNGNMAGARRELDSEAQLSTTPVSLPEIWRLKAAVDAQDALWPSSWQNLSLYLRYSKLDESAP